MVSSATVPADGLDSEDPTIPTEKEVNNKKDQLAKEQSRAQALSIHLLKYCSCLHDSNKPHQAYNGLAHL